MKRNIVYGALAAAFVYTAAAFAVFEWRHPWATGTERTVYARSALTFDTVPYEVMRPREAK